MRVTLPFFSAIFILFFSASCNNSKISGPATGSSKDSDVISVMSYNIHHANPPSKPNVIDLNAIANVINKQKPDLVALQEVDVHTNRSGIKLHEAEELARLTGTTAYFGKAIDYDGGEYGVAILSKFPMSNMRNFALPTAEGTNGEHRTLATAIITLPGNKKILFASTHLDAQRNDTNRLLQINKILEILKKETLPIIIAGDFNDVPSSRVIGLLDNYFTRSCTIDCPFTIPVNNPNRVIDFIAYSPSSKFRLMKHEVIDEKYASDHLPVIAEFKIK
jgi:endonuclease/exonuclease/phosphatase family metal-dependent hydrolase